ncbi:TonB-dependent siderophore receptor [Roseomonas sp. NAR14]|uniref:TonB-dependent siderophore receptor n=1 Tax=Roseomonas acroporae TaxID=2937791 RepID=A0A9X1Y6B8_9PROT|nr:TonB-dependent siderophore receptor [Roseomonas acroporae]MCK8784308.1 TonB-dependent siderophore receptor [Roseomonas acroporae]
MNHRPSPPQGHRRADQRALFPASLLLGALACGTASAQPAITAPETPAGTAAPDATALPTVTTQERAETATGRVQGFVAGRTATATKTDTPTIETPQSVTTITRDQMDAQNVQSVSAALRYAAGVVPELRPGRYDSIALRGFGGFGNAAYYPSFLDGLRLQRGQGYAIPTIDPYLLERIDILRGPAAVIYGQVSPGGVVNMVSRRPTATPYNEVRLEAGTYGRVQAGFNSSGPLDREGQLSYSLTGIGRTAGTAYDGVRDDRVAIAPAITWRPSADTTVTLLASYQNDPEAGLYSQGYRPGGIPAAYRRYFDSRFNVGDPGYEHFRRTLYTAGYQVEHRVNDALTLRQNFRYSHMDTDFQAIAVTAVSNAGVLTRRATAANENFDGIALDNQAQLRFATGPLQHTVLAGLDWQRTTSYYALGQGTAPTLSLSNPLYYVTINRPAYTQRTDQSLSQIGLYAQDQIQWGGLRMTLGVRHDWLDQDTTQRLAGASGSQNPGHTSGRVGLLYLFDSGIAPYFSWATSFEPVSGTYAPARGGAAFQPTTGEQYEVGVKYQPTGVNALLTVSAFTIRQQNVLTTDPSNTSYSIQTGEVRSRGVEVEGRASLNRNLDLIAAYTYLDAAVTRSTSVAIDNRPAGVPSHIVSGWANYNFREGTPLNGLSLGGGVRFIGSTYGDAANTFKVKSVTLADLAVSYDLGGISPRAAGAALTLNVSNLFDREYLAACGATTSCYWGTRRTVIGGLRYRW